MRSDFGASCPDTAASTRGLTMNPHGSLQTTTARPAEVFRVGVAKPDETIRAGAAKPSLDPVNMPAPQGTVKRMDAISKAFSKK